VIITPDSDFLKILKSKRKKSGKLVPHECKAIPGASQSELVLAREAQLF
jgi:hypothetical protein